MFLGLIITLFQVIFGILKLALSIVIKVLAKCIHFFHLGIPFVYIVVGLIIHLFSGAMIKGSAFFNLFHYGLIVVFALSVILMLRAVFHPGKFNGCARTVASRKENAGEDKLRYIPRYYDKPIVHRVKEHPKFLVYEFYDRFQVFRETRKGLEYIRTDYKSNPPPPMKMKRRDANGIAYGDYASRPPDFPKEEPHLYVETIER